MVCVSPREGCEARDELRDEKGLEQGLVAAAKEEAGDPHLATIPPATPAQPSPPASIARPSAARERERAASTT